MATFLVIHGPNLNLLGKREPEIYGHQTLDGINQQLHQLAAAEGHTVDAFQSNHEGALVDRIQACMEAPVAAILINAGALTHTSIAIRDALAAIDTPIYEVHISNVYRREPFRHHSYLSDIAVGVVAGLGAFGYEAALRAAMRAH